VYVSERWHDCDERGVEVDGWTGLLSCPPAAELCALAADLHWPEITLVRPSFGPAGGGTSITVVGHWLHTDTTHGGTGGGDFGSGDGDGGELDDGNSAEGGGGANLVGTSGGGNATSHATQLVVCGIEATDVRWAPLTNAPNASVAVQQLVAVTPALPASFLDASRALNVSCHVTVRNARGREAIALNSFRYEREPEACTILANGIGGLDWSVPTVTSLYICLWPYVLAAMAGMWVLRGGWRLSAQLSVLRRAEVALERREVTRMQEGPL
jgi:hypothetical protein